MQAAPFLSVQNPLSLFSVPRVPSSDRYVMFIRSFSSKFVIPWARIGYLPASFSSHVEQEEVLLSKPLWHSWVALNSLTWKQLGQMDMKDSHGQAIGWVIGYLVLHIPPSIPAVGPTSGALREDQPDCPSPPPPFFTLFNIFHGQVPTYRKRGHQRLLSIFGTCFLL